MVQTGKFGDERNNKRVRFNSFDEEGGANENIFSNTDARDNRMRLEQRVTNLQPYNLDSKSIIILKDPPTRESVIPIFTQWFSENGIRTTIVESLSEVNSEDLIFSYRAWWGWDMALYMSKAELFVKSGGQTLGSIHFDAMQYGQWGKFGPGDQRLRILLGALFGRITREEADKQLGDV